VLKILAGSFEHSWPIVVLLLLFLFVFSVLGMQLFGGSLNKAFNPYMRFDNIQWSFVNTFMILTGENWPTMFYAAFKRTDASAVIYFVMWIILGQYILLNLVVAVILDECSTIMEDEHTNKTKRRKFIKIMRHQNIRRCVISS